MHERKKTLRREIRKRFRCRFEGEEGLRERKRAEAALVDQIDAWSRRRLPDSVGVLWAFWPTLPEEPDFLDWIDRAIARGVTVGLPRLDWTVGKLAFHSIKSIAEDLEFDARGLAQPLAGLPVIGPEIVSAVLVPGLAFDRFGGRLGRGAGFYDRTLVELPEGVPKWAVGFDFQVVESVPVEHWDRRVDGLILPSGPISCDRPA